MNKKHLLIAMLAASCHIATAALVTFENSQLDFELDPESFKNQSDGEFLIGDVSFINNYDDDEGTWSGFAISNITDSTTSPTNEFGAVTGGGFGGSQNYAIGLYATDGFTTTVSFPTSIVVGAYVTNTAWVAYEILNEGFTSKKFGGPSGDDPDWFKLVIDGFADFTHQGTIEFYLADYRFGDNSQDYLLEDWQFVDLSSFGNVDRVDFRVESSVPDMPLYFAMDNFQLVPEPSSLLMALGGFGLLLRRRR